MSEAKILKQEKRGDKIFKKKEESNPNIDMRKCKASTVNKQPKLHILEKKPMTLDSQKEITKMEARKPEVSIQNKNHDIEKLKVSPSGIKEELNTKG